MRKTVSCAVAVGLSVAVLTGCQSAGTSEANVPAAKDDTSTTGEAPEASASTMFSLEVGEGLGIEGVSPELITHPDGGYLLLATGLSEDLVYRSEDGLSFTPDSTMRIPMGSDYSLLQKPDGTWLLYYVSFDAPTSQPA